MSPRASKGPACLTGKEGRVGKTSHNRARERTSPRSNEYIGTKIMEREA